MGITFAKKGIRLLDETANLLTKSGIRAPKKAMSYDIVKLNNGLSDIDIYSFRDSSDKVIKRLKVNTNPSTGTREVQVRYYEYLGQKGNTRKLNKVSQHNFNSNNECVGGKNWDFYYPSENAPVLFSRNTPTERVNNFIKTNDYIIDGNGFKIKPISIGEYLDTKKALGRRNIVDDPWTTKQSITRDNAIATDSIKECTVVGIAGDKGLSLNHFNPNNSDNYDIDQIIKTLKGQISQQGKKSKAFIMGSGENDAKSNQQFHALKNFLEQERIPFSSYKTGDKVFDDIRAKCPNSLDLMQIYKKGLSSPFYFAPGQHIICDGNEIKITNAIIDSELRQGNTCARDLINKSFSQLA